MKSYAVGQKSKNSQSQIAHLQRMILKSCAINNYLAIAAIVIMMYELVVVWEDDENEEEVGTYVATSLTTILKLCITIISLIQMVVCHKQYEYRFELFMLSSNANVWGAKEIASLFVSPLFGPYVTEMLICFAHLPPGFDFEVVEADGDIDFFLTDKFNLIVFSRVYLIVQYVRLNQSIFARRYQYAFANPDVNLDFFDTFWFGAKNLFNARPMRTLNSYLFFMWFTCGFAIMCAEREKNPAFSDFSNCLWFSMVTMTTAGYGDFYPTHDLARLVAMFAAFNGIACASIATGIVSNALEFTDKEKVAVEYTNEADANEDLRNASSSLIAAMFQMRRAKKNDLPEQKQFEARKKVYHAMRAYRSSKEEFLSQQESSVDKVDYMMHMIESLEEALNHNTKKIEKYQRYQLPNGIPDEHALKEATDHKELVTPFRKLVASPASSSGLGPVSPLVQVKDTDPGIVVAIGDYIAKNDKQLSFAKGDLIEVIKETNKWDLGILRKSSIYPIDGAKLVFPSNFVRVKGKKPPMRAASLI